MKTREDEPVAGSMFFDDDGPPGSSAATQYAEDTEYYLNPRNVIPFHAIPSLLSVRRMARAYTTKVNPDPDPAA